ncbi:unnamed protein product [marine sediment metagenome]|uniref:Uncharacterized protein n=1 Tax=marine sediment metagenome TaxID=412755 RepID=X1B336_9ZZZZ
MTEKDVQQLGEAIEHLDKAKTILKRVQIEISSELFRLENKKEKR